MKTYIFFLLHAVAANATAALSTSALHGTSELVVESMSHGTTIHDEGKRLLRVNERSAVTEEDSTTDEERGNLPQQTIDFLSQMETRAEPGHSREKHAKALEIVAHLKQSAKRQEAQAEYEKALTENKRLKSDLIRVIGETEEGAAVQKLGGTVYDMLAVVEPTSKDTMIGWWGLDADLVEERQRILESYPEIVKNFEKRVVENMAVGSVYNYDKLGKGKGKQAGSHQYSQLVEKYFEFFLRSKEEFFEKLIGDDNKVSQLALAMYHNERRLPSILTIVDMAVGKEFFRILEREGL